MQKQITEEYKILQWNRSFENRRFVFVEVLEEFNRIFDEHEMETLYNETYESKWINSLAITYETKKILFIDYIKQHKFLLWTKSINNIIEAINSNMPQRISGWKDKSSCEKRSDCYGINIWYKAAIESNLNDLFYDELSKF